MPAKSACEICGKSFFTCGCAAKVNQEPVNRQLTERLETLVNDHVLNILRELKEIQDCGSNADQAEQAMRRAAMIVGIMASIKRLAVYAGWRFTLAVYAGVEEVDLNTARLKPK